MPTLLGTNLPQSIRSEAEKLRNLFLASLMNQQPFDCRETIRKRYFERLDRTPDGIMLGEVAPFLIISLVSPSEPQANSSLIQAWHKLYVATILFDDQLDLENSTSSRDEKTAFSLGLMSLLARGTADLAPYLPSINLAGEYVDPIVSRCYIEFVQTGWNRPPDGEVFEADKEGNYPKSTYFGYKNHLLTLLAHAWVSAEGGEFPDSVKAALLKLQTSIQLLDDLTDIVEDNQAKRWTLPLVILQRRLWELNKNLTLHKMKLCSVSEDKLMEKLAGYTGTTHLVLQQAHQLLAEALELLPTNSSESRQFVEALCHHLGKTVDQAATYQTVLNETTPVTRIQKASGWGGLTSGDFSAFPAPLEICAHT